MSGLATIGVILAVMAAVAVVETAVPLHGRARGSGPRVTTNLALTGITFATNLLLNGALVTGLAWLDARGLGVLHAVAPPPAVGVAVVVVVLDFSLYVAHVCMHFVPTLWRFHRVHHSDPFVDVTTTIRQHPGEGLVRYAFVGAFACALGASPGAFAVYRVCSAVNALFEHANVRVPPGLDRLLSLVTTWPNMHKVHHSRRVHETNTNYGNLFSAFDRLFGTFTPSRCGTDVAYGLDGFDDAATQTTTGLLALPFRRDAAASKGELADGGVLSPDPASR